MAQFDSNTSKPPKTQANQAKPAKTERLTYTARLRNALKHFAGGLAAPVANPLKARYKEAYDHLIKGDSYQAHHMLNDARGQYELALDAAPDFTEARVALAKCFKYQGQPDVAVKHLKIALKQNFFDASVHHQLAMTFTEMGHVANALHHYQKAVQLAPRQLDITFDYAVLLETTGHVAEAESTYRDILAAEPEFFPAAINLGNLYLHDNQLRAAQEVFEDLIERAPEFSRGYLGLAVTLDKLGDVRKALYYYNRVRSMRPNSEHREFINRRVKDLSRQYPRSRTPMIRVK